MAHFLSGLTAAVLAFVALGADAFAAPVLASATRTVAFTSSSTSAIPIPLRDNNTTALQFETTIANQTVTFFYNAECDIAAPRSTWLSIRILVDGVEANPITGSDFALCSAIDTDGQTWVSASRQSMMKVPVAGNHTVRVFGRLVSGAGTWRIDDSSLVVQRSVTLTATRKGSIQGTDTTITHFPLRDNGATSVDFPTASNFQKVRVTFNAECVVSGNYGTQQFEARVEVFGGHPIPYNNVFGTLCNPPDTTGAAWSGRVRQLLVTIPTAGDYSARVIGRLNSGTGTWRVDDSSLVVDQTLIAYSIRDTPFDSSSTREVAVPLTQDGATTFQFTTVEASRVVRVSYSAICAIAATRGHWVSVRIVVDGVEAEPAVGHNFAFCSSLSEFELLYYNYAAGFRQSVINLPAGAHTVQVFARVLGPESWSWELSRAALTIE